MPRLIDADEIFYTEYFCTEYPNTTEKLAFKSLIDKMPTVDAVEVVRCKDCKYNYANQIPSDDVCQRCVELPINKDFYCAWGERKDE